ncbi:hypothetical protein BSL78_12647 [Apostichopus japonicus]|uniref:Peptidase S8/S53 domain-containing protein n=1 Tax=Stichopus japonicus TaxID=307972 RepID=A0A2G8KR12_STIJA|nr:hypothetical protein BSL78_12647 [Apostichopus japonicus]
MDGCDVADTARNMNKHFSDYNMNTKVRHQYKRTFHGVCVEDMSLGALRWMMQQGCIEYMEEVGMVKATLDPEPITMKDGNYLNWGLDRITDKVYDSDYNYNPARTGNETEIYIVDSGVRRTHLEFGGRAYYLNTFNDPLETDDCFGHGTQTSGVAIGTWRGTATMAKVTSVKVLDCQGEGTSDDLLTALNKILDDRPYGNAVVSMSLTIDVDYSYIRDAIVDLINSSFVVVASAGNYNDDGCYYFPAGYSQYGVIGVGAINARGNKASFSNHGSCVDIYAPGANIYTATNEGDDQLKKLSGTSFSTPFVSGAAAMLLEEGFSPFDVKNVLISDSTTTVDIGNLPANSHNRILFVESKK